MNIQLEIEQRIQEIEAVLKKYLPKEEGYQKTVLEAMNYSVLAGGKRLLLVWSRDMCLWKMLWGFLEGRN